MIYVMNRALPYLMSDDIVVNRASVEFWWVATVCRVSSKREVRENVLQTFQRPVLVVVLAAFDICEVSSDVLLGQVVTTLDDLFWSTH
jgi:hypothetical protein